MSKLDYSILYETKNNLKRYNSLTPQLRFRVTTKRLGISNESPVKSLLYKKLVRNCGRNNFGRITSYHRGTGCKRKYRIVDFKRTIKEGKVIRIEYDPNRSGHLALIEGKASSQCCFEKARHHTGEHLFSYILATHKLSVGDVVHAGKTEISDGSCLELRDIPEFTRINSVELRPGEGGVMIRAAGSSGRIVQKTERMISVELPSKKLITLLPRCRAVVGTVSNADHRFRCVGGAGYKRHTGRRPITRGVAMNPVDHPMGGGEGKSSGGRPSCSPWGRPTKGYKTRHPNPRKK